MLCKKCGCELRIRGSYPYVVDGSVCFVHDLACVNPKCPAGKSLLPTERVVNPYLTDEDRDAVCCCGVPLAYVTNDAYSVPDASLIRAFDTESMTVACPVCGETRIINITGKTKEE